MSSDVPGLRGLARRIASGALQGPAAFDAVVAFITAHEAEPGLDAEQIRELREQVVLGVRHDRELCAVLFELRSEDGMVNDPRRDAAEAMREAARRRKPRVEEGARRVRPEPALDELDDDVHEAVRGDAKRRGAKARRTGAEADRRVPKRPKEGERDADDFDGFASPQRRTQVVGFAVVGAVVVGGVVVWAATRTDACDRLVKDICFDSSTKECDADAFRDALKKGGFGAEQCERVRTDIAAALEGVDTAQRSKVFNRALLEAVGFDPRGDLAPPPPPSEEEEEAAKQMKPVPVVSDQTGIATLFVDSSHLYWTRPDPAGVLRARSIGGTPELVGTTPDPIDVTATRDYVYWVSRAGPQTQVWVDPKRGTHEPAPLATPGFLPQRAAFMGADFAFVDATTGAVVVADVSGGAPRKLTEGGVPAPTLLAGDAKTIWWATPAPVGTLTAAAIDGSAPPSVVATGLADPRALLVDESGVYWIEGSTGSIMRLQPGQAVETLATKQADPRDLALDEARVYWTNAGGGTVMAMPKTGGEAVAVATGQSAPTHVVVDGAAVYWVAGDDVMRMPK